MVPIRFQRTPFRKASISPSSSPYRSQQETSIELQTRSEHTMALTTFEVDRLRVWPSFSVLVRFSPPQIGTTASAWGGSGCTSGRHLKPLEMSARDA